MVHVFKLFDGLGLFQLAQVVQFEFLEAVAVLLFLHLAILFGHAATPTRAVIIVYRFRRIRLLLHASV